MFEIFESNKHIDGIEIPTFGREVADANIIQVEAGTNGYQGGDSGHGSRTFFCIKNLGGTDIRAISKHNGDELQIYLGGDAELRTFIKALKFAVKVLEDQSQGIDD